MIVSDYLERSTKLFPNKTVLKFGDRNYSYQEIDGLVNNLSTNLKKIGIGYQDRILITTGNKPETIISILAASRIGSIFVPINPHLKWDKFSSVCKTSQPACIVMDEAMEENIIKEKENLEKVQFISCGQSSISGIDRVRFHRFDTITEKFLSEYKVNKPIDVDIASIMFTSGSTGEPKGVTLTHGNIDSASSSIIQYLKNTSEDIILNSIPLSFDYGMYQALMAIKFGGTIILERSFAFFNLLLERIHNEKVTGFPIVPTMAEILFKLGNLKDFDLSSLRYITNTAQALSPTTIIKLKKLFPDVEIYSMYGLTECKRVSYLDPKLVLEKPTSVGKAIPNTEIFIIDEKGMRINEPGKIGELGVRGPHIMLGYWNDPITTEKVIIKGNFPGDRVLLTGDMFKFDDEGDFYFIGRKDNLVKIGGEKASPVEVERVIESIDGITSCIVISVPDIILGNKFICIACRMNDISEEYVKKYCSERLEKFLLPKKIIFVNELPLTSNGKIDRQAIIRNINNYWKE